MSDREEELLQDISDELKDISTNTSNTELNTSREEELLGKIQDIDRKLVGIGMNLGDMRFKAIEGKGNPNAKIEILLYLIVFLLFLILIT